MLLLLSPKLKNVAVMINTTTTSLKHTVHNFTLAVTDGLINEPNFVIVNIIYQITIIDDVNEATQGYCSSQSIGLNLWLPTWPWVQVPTFG